jgi:hypothetical protein
MSGTGTVVRGDYIPSNDLGNASVETLFTDINKLPNSIRVPTDNQLTNKRFTLHIGGRVATTSNLTFTVNLRFGTTRSLSDTLVFTSQAMTVNAKKTNWHMDIYMFWDGDSQLINANGIGQVDNSVIGPTGLANAPTVDPNLHNTSNSFQATFYRFTASGQFSGSSAGNHAFIDVFELEIP